MTRASDDRFNDWKLAANSIPLLEVATIFGAKLKRAGKEHVGPCVVDGGTDRFAISPSRGCWNCRGSEGGGDSISLAMHLGGLSFLQACEMLTGQPNPSGGPARPLSPSEQSERENRRAANEAAQRQRQAQEEAYQEDTKEMAAGVWGSSVSLGGTIAERYLNGRGIPTPAEGWPACLRFHGSLPYPKKPNTYPALICRVDDMSGDLCAIWRIFLRADGRKADVDNCKLGLGPAGGGAVRLGGIGPKVAIAEGIESALGFWFLIGRKYPVLAALSTSGMIGIELPLCVERVIIAPDGDQPIRKQGEEYVPAIPAGRKAAMTLRGRLVGEGLSVQLAAEPGPGQDYLDIFAAMAREVA